MSITLSALQQQRRDTAANWTSANPTLLAGELGYETDTGKWKVGDGSTAWTALGYTPWSQISYPIVNADVSATAEIAVSKLANGTANQVLVTDGTDVSWSDDLTVAGNLTVNGTTTTVNSTTVTVDDKNIELGSVATPTDTTANGGGITLKGATDKTISWLSATGSWTFSEHVDLASGKDFKIDGTSVLSGSTLGSGVTTSSLTTVGTISTGTWSASTIAVDKGGTGQTSYTDGQLLIGKTDGTLAKATLTAGSGATITNADGSITIAAAGTGLPSSGGTLTGDLTLSNQADLRFGEATANGSNFVAFQAPAAIGSDVTWTLPDADAAVSGYALVSDGSGQLSWAAVDDISDTAPERTFTNTTQEDTDGGRESKITFKGEQSGGEISTLAQIEISHDGTNDDEKGKIIFKTNDGSDGSSPTDAMAILSNGNVGIGTTSPSSILEASTSVNTTGKIRITNTNSGTGANAAFLAHNGTFDAAFGIGGTNYTTYAGIRANGAFIYCNQAAGIGLTADNANGFINFVTGGSTERMRIDSSGNVGIGFTSPLGKLHVRAADECNFVVREESTSLVLSAETNSGRDNNRVMTLEGNGFVFNANGTERLRIGSAGQIGIGGANYGTSGQVLTSQGASAAPQWADAGGSGGFDAGTAMLFQQTAAPTGWTKSTTHNNKALRVVSGTAGSGGSSNFDSVFGSSISTNAHTLTTAQIPSHTHTISAESQELLNSFFTGDLYYERGDNRYATTITTNATGGGGSHSHTMSMDIAYVDTIIATKD